MTDFKYFTATKKGEIFSLKSKLSSGSGKKRGAVENGEAIEYYFLGICSNPRRIDSWSAMALARGSQLEMKLNSVSTLPLKTEGDVLKNAELTDKCYKTALDLDSTQSTLWIEYGVFCYAVHAFCSRLLKQETTNLSLQMFDMLENRKDKFLNTSYRCFNSANEAWLTLTSKHEDVQDERLPILYSSPQYYSVEALEIYYRVHSTILKILEVYEEKSLDNTTINILKIFVERMAESPFMSARLNSLEILDAMFDGHSVSGNEENEPKAKLGIHEFNADELDEVPQFVSTLKSNEADREGIDENTGFESFELPLRKLPLEGLVLDDNPLCD
ncbi:hypothetical protein V9T40_004613 [Parthenolecanium corni]|uniref:Uncharacterized protein n=1 Tax=Parthenolecanium corni TaxID=536013 RepID=A0AAN9YB56_9HEMI